MSLQTIAYNLISLSTISAFLLIGYSNGQTLEITALIINILSGIFGIFAGLALYSYGNFNNGMAILPVLFVFLITIPINSIIKKVIIPHFIKNRSNNSPLFYKIGAIIGAFRGILAISLFACLISINNNSELTKSIKNSFTSRFSIDICKILDINIKDIQEKSSEINMKDKENESLLECKESIDSFNNRTESILEMSENKEIFSKAITKLDCNSLDFINNKISYLKSIDSLNEKIMAIIIARQLLNTDQKDVILDEEIDSFILEASSKYIKNFTIDSIIYHMVLKKRQSKKENKAQIEPIHINEKAAKNNLEEENKNKEEKSNYKKDKSNKKLSKNKK